MAINLTEDNTKDRGAPNRKLKDGTWPATVVESKEYMKNALSVLVSVVVKPTKENEAIEGPVKLTTYIPAELSDKVKDLARLGQYARSVGVGLGSFEPEDHVGKAVRVVTRWTKGKDGYPDRAEIMSFLPPDKGQKPDADMLPIEDDGQGADPFGGA